MSVITISRGTFSGGAMLAECLAKSLGYRCVDRDIIVEGAAARGISQDELRNALEKPPTFLDRLQHKKYLYLAVIQAALVDEVRTGKAVYHGHAGHLLLKGGPQILRVRIIAPLEFRLSMAQKRLKMTRAEALAYIQRMDQDRKKWAQYLYGVDWGDPAQYDVVLNLEYMDVDEACAGLAALVRKRGLEFTPEDQEAMGDLALASHLRAELALHEATSHLEVEIEARRGAVSIHGRIPSVREVEEVMQMVQAAPGVASVDLENLATTMRA
jgi:cytidylate kinase